MSLVVRSSTTHQRQSSPTVSHCKAFDHDKGTSHRLAIEFEHSALHHASAHQVEIDVIQNLTLAHHQWRASRIGVEIQLLLPIGLGDGTIPFGSQVVTTRLHVLELVLAFRIRTYGHRAIATFGFGERKSNGRFGQACSAFAARHPPAHAAQFRRCVGFLTWRWEFSRGPAQNHGGQEEKPQVRKES